MRDISYVLIQLFMSSVGGILLCMTFSISWTAISTSAQSTDEPSQHLMSCGAGCASCSAANGCVTCEAGYYLHFTRHGSRQTGQCLTTCPLGSFGLVKKSHSLCHNCRKVDSSCVTCDNSTFCTACRPPHFAYLGKCMDRCPQGLHFDIATKNCLTEVDCQLSEWSTWQFCHKKGQICGYKYGTQTRSRSIVQRPTDGGKHCTAPTRQTRRCTMTYRYCDEHPSLVNGTVDMEQALGAVQITVQRPISSVRLLKRPSLKPRLAVAAGDSRRQRRHRQREAGGMRGIHVGHGAIH